MGWRLFTVLMAMVCTAGAASAHPHVWTDMRSSLMVNEAGLITGIRAEWTFDEGYSGFALDGLDADGDGVYGPDEIKPLTDENITNLAESDFFGFRNLGCRDFSKLKWCRCIDQYHVLVQPIWDLLPNFWTV